MRNIFTLGEDALEIGLFWLGAIAGLGTLAYAIVNMLVSQNKPTGQQTGPADKLLRTPYLVIATLVFLWLGYFFWKPLPLQIPKVIQLILTVAGSVVLIPSLALYIWGLRSLGINFNVSSGFGVRLVRAHQLITSGPFTYLRHPMYLAIILAGWGGLLLYRTWTMLGFALMMLGLLYRGHKEEEALSQAFGAEWDAYKREVPGWWPRIRRRAGINH